MKRFVDVSFCEGRLPFTEENVASLSAELREGIIDELRVSRDGTELVVITKSRYYNDGVILFSDFVSEERREELSALVKKIKEEREAAARLRRAAVKALKRAKRGAFRAVRKAIKGIKVVGSRTDYFVTNRIARGYLFGKLSLTGVLMESPVKDRNFIGQLVNKVNTAMANVAVAKEALS